MATGTDGWRTLQLRGLADSSRKAIDPQEFPHEEFDYYSIPAYQASGKPARVLGRTVLSSKIVVEPGMVLFGKLNPRVPKVWRVSESPRRKIASTEFIALAPRTEIADGEFLYFLCRSDDVMTTAQGLVSGSTPSRQRVDVRAFLEIPVPVPPLIEQHAIANALSIAQQAKEATEKVIEVTKHLKKSIMLRLFAYGPVKRENIAAIDRVETPIGLLPSRWRVVPLRAVAKIGNGSTPKRDTASYWNGGTIPWLNSTKIHDGLIERAEQFVTATARNDCHLPLVPKNSVLVAITGQGKTLGNAALVAFDTCISQHLAFITVTNEELRP